MTDNRLQMVMKAVSAASLALCIIIAVYGWRTGIFTSQEALKAYIDGFGVAGGIVFTIVQVVQVVIPIIPGGVSCLAGVILFGAWKGFIYNYVGICIGSFIVFAIAKNCGRPILEKLFPKKMMDKYARWTEDARFTKLFALAIFLPVAPDDFLCYLAGTTPMPWRHYVPIILLGKPGAIALYSIGLNIVFEYITQLIR